MEILIKIETTLDPGTVRSELYAETDRECCLKASQFFKKMAVGGVDGNVSVVLPPVAAPVPAAVKPAEEKKKVVKKKGFLKKGE